jgi:hypothetical protein
MSILTAEAALASKPAAAKRFIHMISGGELAG